MKYDKNLPYTPGAQIDVIDPRKSETLRAGVILYVGSDMSVLVGWDDESTSVVPQQSLLLRGIAVPRDGAHSQEIEA